MRLFLLLLWALGACVFGQALQPAAVTLTKGSLSLDATGVTFQTKDKDHQYPFAPNKSSPPGSANPQIPGLSFVRFEHRMLIPAAGGPEKDVSRLILTSSDDCSIELVAGQPVEVYRIEITFADQRQMVVWQLASKVK